MSREEEIIAKPKQLDEDLQLAMDEECDAVVADVREKIKRLYISATELKGTIKGRIMLNQNDDAKSSSAISVAR